MYKLWTKRFSFDICHTFFDIWKCRQGWRSGTRHSWSASPRCRKPCPGPTLKDGVLKVLKVRKLKNKTPNNFFLRNEIDGMCQNGYVVNWLNWYELICVCIRVVFYTLDFMDFMDLQKMGKRMDSATKCALRCRDFCHGEFHGKSFLWSDDRKVKWLLKWPGKEKFRNQYSVSENES